MTICLGLDIGSNSVGSAWVHDQEGVLATGTSIFPAGVDESDEKRGDPKNLKRRMARRTRITLARRAERKRQLRLKLISVGLLPPDEVTFKELLERTDPWALRRKGLGERLSPHEFGRVLLHLAQRRGALGFDSDADDEGKVKKAVTNVQLAMLGRYGSDDSRQTGQNLKGRIDQLGKKKGRTDQEGIELEKACDDLKELCKSLLEKPDITVGRLMADLSNERRHNLNDEIGNPKKSENGNPSHYSDPIRNRRDSFEFHADRALIRDEFAKLWNAQKRLGGPLADNLSSELRSAIDDESGNSDWRHKGLLFGQRRASWDLGTLGRCALEPTERCAPHADMYASRFLVVETVNNLKIIESGKEARSLKREEHELIKNYLIGPLGEMKKVKQKGQPKRSVTVSDLRELMDWSPAGKTAQFRFNIESDEERIINTDWFSREIIHGAVTLEKWEAMPERVREGINRAILKFDPTDEKQAAKLKTGVMQWAQLTEPPAEALVAAWKKRPKPDSKRLNMSRRAVRNVLALMDRAEPWPDPNRPGQLRWLTQIEARKLIAQDADFKDVTTDKPLDDYTRRRYSTGTKGATARDRYYMRKHLLRKNGELILGPDGTPLAEPPPAPLISNPVVRKAIHEVRRHLVEYMTTFERKPDEIYIELSREAKMGKKEADELLFKNRLRNRIRNDIIDYFGLDSNTSTQQRAAVSRVVLAVQQGCVCPLCGRTMADDNCDGITLRTAAMGQGCEVAHIIPKASGGHNGFGNIVLAHTKCNRDMERRTPRRFWEAKLRGGLDEGMSWIEKIYRGIERPMRSEVKNATANSLWSCYFTKRDDTRKIEQFKKDIKDIQEMTARQDAATKYAARQVMAYLADAVFEGKGLPERGGDRRIYSTDGMWTSRLRREWGLFFDPHEFKAKGIGHEEEHERKEKNRGDHRHHAVDAIVIARSSRQVQIDWEEREKKAGRDGINTASDDEMENYRRMHPLPPPAPFKRRDEFHEAVRRVVFGDGKVERPICHRPVKRKLIGALHCPDPIRVPTRTYSFAT